MTPIRKHRVLLPGAALIALLPSSGFGAPQQTADPPKSAETKTDPPPQSSVTVNTWFGQSTPEEAVRSFLMATMYQDATTLKAVTMPLSDRDFPYLIFGTPPPKRLASRARSGIASLAIHSYKPGETVSLTREKSFRVRDEMIGPDAALLQPVGAPSFFYLHKINGKWYIFADPIVTERKAAEDARLKQQQDLQVL